MLVVYLCVVFELAYLKQSEVDAYSSIDRLHQMLIVDLCIVDVTADFMTDHFVCGVWCEKILQVVSSRVVSEPLIVGFGRNDDRHAVMDLR